MLNDHELELWKLKLGINQAGSELIDRIRKSDPARAIRLLDEIRFAKPGSDLAQMAIAQLLNYDGPRFVDPYRGGAPRPKVG